MRSAAVAVAIADGCGPGLAAKLPQPDAPAPVQLGTPLAIADEVIEYQVTLHGMTVGRVVVSVGKPGFVDGHRSIIVRSRGTSAGFVSLITDLTWELTTTLDLDTGLPLHEIEESWLAVKGKPKHQRRDRDWSGSGYNVHAATTALRGWHSRIGQRTSAQVTIDQMLVDVELWDAAHEMLVSTEKPAVRYDGIARSKIPFAVWISDDEARVPLLVRADSPLGPISVELVRYDPPSEDR
jgi:hypothetical protein